MTDVKHKMAIESICFAAQVLTPQAKYLQSLVDSERDMHSHLHITNPTLYREAINSDNLRRQVALSRAALTFLKAVEDVKAEIIGEQPSPPEAA